jgi:hypothetical protein
MKCLQETDAFFAHSIVFDQNKSQSLTSRCAIREKFAHLYEWVVTKEIVERRDGEPIKFLFLPKMGLLGSQAGNEKNCWL